MTVDNETNENAENTKNSPQNSSSGLRWVLIGGGVAWETLLAIAIWHPGIIGRVKFFSDSTLNLFIVLAVIAQVLIYRKQWFVMERQGQLQQANLRQWVDIEVQGVRTESDSESEPHEEVAITLRWKLLNNTHLPFTLERIDIKVCREGDWEVFETVEDAVIPPTGGGRNFCPFFVRLKLTKSQTEEFLNDGIGLSIATRITYVDATGTRREQFFSELYDCRLDELTVCDAFGKTPTFTGIEKGDEEARLVTSEVNIVTTRDIPTLETVE